MLCTSYASIWSYCTWTHIRVKCIHTKTHVVNQMKPRSIKNAFAERILLFGNFDLKSGVSKETRLLFEMSDRILALHWTCDVNEKSQRLGMHMSHIMYRDSHRTLGQSYGEPPNPTQKIIIGSTSALSCLRHQAGLGWRHSSCKLLSLFLTLLYLPVVWHLHLKVDISTPLLTSTGDPKWQVEGSEHWRPYWILPWFHDEQLWSCPSSSGSFVSVLCLYEHPTFLMSKGDWIFERVWDWTWPTSTCSASPSSVGQLKGSRALCPRCPISTAWASCAAPAAATMSTASGWNARARSSACPSSRTGTWLRSCTSFLNSTWSRCPTSTQMTII